MSDCNPCSSTTGNECPNGFCDDRFLDLPKRQRVRLLAVEQEGKCFVEFPNGAKGFVVADGCGFTVTEAPCVEIPISKTYAKDPVTGEVLYDECNVPIEAPNPGWENIIITDADGCQNRLGGLVGIPADLHWDGTKFILKPTEDDGTVQLSDYPTYTGDCDTYDMVLRAEEICSPTEGSITKATIGYRPSTAPRIPYGLILPYGGADDTIPDGWLKCDGSTLQISEYTNLYDVIGVNYGGAGTGFDLPDMRRRTPLGIADAASPLPAVDFNDTFSIVDTTNSEGTFQSDYQVKAASAQTQMGNVPTSASIPATFDSVASGVTQVVGTITFTPPVGATHLILNSWLLVACNVSQHSARAVIKIDAPNYTPAVPDGPAEILINATYAGVDDAEATGAVAEGVGGRYDCPILAGAAAVTAAEAIPTVWNYEINFDVSTPMIAYYGFEIWQHGYRMNSDDTSGAELIGTNFIIYAGAPTSCTNA